MRKIEKQMIETIKDHRDSVALGEVQHKEKTLENTKLLTTLEDGLVVTKVFLHNNLIAQGNWHKWQFSMCGWPIVTTKSRINALASAFGHAGVYTKKGKHYSGDKEVNAFDWF